jgi:hypothetical protein
MLKIGNKRLKLSKDDENLPYISHSIAISDDLYMVMSRTVLRREFEAYVEGLFLSY